MTTRSPALTTPTVAVQMLPAHAERRLAVVLADGRPSREWPTAHAPLICCSGLRSRFDEQWRLRMLAERTARLVLSVQLPGCERGGPSLSGKQRLALLNGDFGPVADEALRALADALTPGQPAHPEGSAADALRDAVLVGSGLGASVAGATARVMLDQGWGRPERLVLIEPVAMAAQPLPALAVAGYRPISHLRADLHRADLAAYALGISAGRIPRELARIMARPDRIAIDLVRGGRSRLVRAARVTRVRDALSRNGVPGELVVIPEATHDLWRDPATVAYLADRLLR